MVIYNTLTRKKEELKTIKDKEIKIYACGPTVYNLMHIGNARQICVFDVFKRYMEFRGYKVIFAQNFTDVDDKIIKKANEEGVDYSEISEKYIKEYETDAHGLNVRDADIHPKATENIDEIIKIIEKLVEDGTAYATESGDVYFSPDKFAHYGKLSHQPLEDLKSGARIFPGEDKKEPVDFALWKSAKPGEPFWESPWGNGRPGWHIECSAMVNRYLGETIDIHGGGQDLIFPHHENEIAQSESYNGKELANYWMHNGHVNVDNKKMSKSLGNFFTVRDVANEYGYEPIRYLLISSHYRSPMNYSTDSLKQSIAALERLYSCKDNLIFNLEHAETESMTSEERERLKEFKAHEDKFIEVMDDDLNTADGLAAIFELARDINTYVTADSSKEFGEKSLDLFTKLTDILGILYEKSDSDNVDIEVEELIAQRNDARANKDWAKSDEIRDRLTEMGITLEDTPNGVKWRYLR